MSRGFVCTSWCVEFKCPGNFAQAFLKSLLATNFKLPEKKILISMQTELREPCARPCRTKEMMQPCLSTYIPSLYLQHTISVFAVSTCSQLQEPCARPPLAAAGATSAVPPVTGDGGAGGDAGAATLLLFCSHTCFGHGICPRVSWLRASSQVLACAAPKR